MLLLLLAFSWAPLAQVSSAPHRDLLTQADERGDVANDKVSHSHAGWGKCPSETCWSAFYAAHFSSLRILLTCSLSTLCLSWWQQEIRCSQSWRKRTRWCDNIRLSPKENARQAAATSSGRPSRRVNTELESFHGWLWSVILSFTAEWQINCYCKNVIVWGLSVSLVILSSLEHFSLNLDSNPWILHFC